MCRLFAVVSAEPFSLHRPLSALAAQSHEHPDGWGMARFDDAPALERSIAPAHTCEQFRAARASASRFAVVHIRQGSVGDVSLLNTHPFESEGWYFAHNGTVRNFEARKQAFDALLSSSRRGQIRGATDSEHCFALLLEQLGAERSMHSVARALARTSLQLAELFGEEAEKKTSMNFVLTDGQRLWVSRFGKTLFHARRGTAHLVASEPLWHDDAWAELGEQSILAIDRDLSFERWSFGALAR